MADELRLDFGNLPLVEAVLRVTLVRPLDLTFQRIIELHKRLRDGFPSIGELNEYELAPGATMEPIRLAPNVIAGVVYFGGAEGVRLTVQRHVLVLRWLKLAGEQSPKYPRYPHMRSAVWGCFSAVDDVFGGGLRIAAVNMSYVNFVQAASGDDILDYFSNEVHVQALFGAKPIRLIELSWRNDQGFDTRFRLQGVRAQAADGDQPTDGYHLTTVVGSPVAGGDMRAGTQLLDTVHGHLQSLFLRVLSDRARKEWQLEVSGNE